MNIRDFLKNKQDFKRTTQFKNSSELEYKEYINQLVYNFGEVYMFLGICDDWDDCFYIMADSSGVIHYHSCVGELGQPLQDMMTDVSYKKFKNFFIKNLKYQREWRTKFDNRIYLPESNEFNVVEYYTQNGMPFIKERRTNIDKAFKKPHLSKEEKRDIRKKFWEYFWHMFGLHCIYERDYIYDEYKLDQERDLHVTTESEGILTGRCDVCNRRMQIKLGWICNWSIWYKHKWLGKLCKPFIRFFDLYKRAK